MLGVLAPEVFHSLAWLPVPGRRVCRVAAKGSLEQLGFDGLPIPRERDLEPSPIVCGVAALDAHIDRLGEVNDQGAVAAGAVKVVITPPL